MDLAHPFAVAAGEVIVDRYHVNALSLQSGKVGGQSCHQGFSFPRSHFGNAPLIQDDAALQLTAEVPHAKNAVGGFPHGGERLGQKIVQGLPLRQTGTEFGGLAPQLLVGQGAVGFLQRLDGVHEGIDFLQFLLAVGAK